MKREMNSIRHYAAIIIVPALMFCLPLILRDHYGPYFLGYNSDPDYAYLLNALNIINAIPPGHTDHPGTTVQLLGSVGLLLKWLSHLAWGGHFGVNQFVLRHPEESLGAINLLLNILIFIAFCFSSMSIYRAMRGIGPVMVFQLSLLIPLQVKLSLFRVDPEPLLVFTVLLLSGLLVRYQLSDKATPPRFRIPFFVGAVMGFGIATKITFIPIVLLVALFQTTRERLLVACGCITSFLLFTLPIITKYPKMFSWFGALATHKDQYGKGEVGLPPLAKLMANLQELIQKEPFLFIFLACYLIYLMAKTCSAKQPITGKSHRFIALGAVVIIIQVVMTIKHPGVHYLLPAITLTALLNAVLVDTLKNNPDFAIIRLGNYIFCALIFAGIIYGSYVTKSWASDSEKYLKNEIALSNKINSMSGCSAITYYRASSIEYALAFSNEYSSFSFARELSMIYPDKLFYHLWSGVFYTYQSEVSTHNINDLLMKNRCLLVVGVPMDENYGNNLELTLLDNTTRGAVYKLERLKY